MIKAENGSGKSTILDALAFVLFGKPYRNIKLGQLVNRFNDKDLEVELEFEIGKDEYSIMRGYKPAKFNMTMNGQDLNVLSAKKLNQEEIDKLLGINYVLFKNIVAVASTYNKPFLTLSASERRNLIEVIFNINVIASMLNEVKRRSKMNQTQQQLNTATMSGLNEQIASVEKFVNETSKIIEKFEQDKKAAIEKLESDIAIEEGLASQCKKNISIADKKSAELAEQIDDREATRKYTDCKSDLNTAERIIKEVTETLETLKNQSVCPVCGSELTNEHASAHIKELNRKLEKNKSDVESLVACITNLESELKKIRDNKKLYDMIIVKRADQINKLATAKKQIEELLQKKKQQESSVCNIDIEQYKNQFNSLQTRIADLARDMTSLDEKISLDKTLAEILGDSGLKTFFFKQLLPQLNSQVNKYIAAFNLQITLEFDHNLNAVIQQGKYECEYASFSAGERARIDMAILLAFFDISRNISNWSCNILFIDEVMDGGVDATGVEQFISTLFNVVSGDMHQKLGIYLISHKLGNVDVAWDSIVEISKTNRFSELKVVNSHEDSNSK